MDQTNFNFIESKKAYETRFFQFPQVLLYGEKYKKLSDSAKLGYMILRDRLDYSLRNNWIDEKNRVYFIFTNQELHNLFGWGNAKIVKVKKELERAKLLYQVNLGFDPKKKKNLPNHLYLADLEVTTKDIYKKKITNEEPKSLDTSGSFKMKPRQKEPKSLDTSGSFKMK
ncbi:plasmid replication initiation protein, partial [Lentilactobacillus buchneri]|uniref:replication initiator protein A n=2 Tax=Lentilactobacillus TaxID=2767893 RepID=UPI0021A4925F